MKARAFQGSQSMEPKVNNSVRLVTRVATGIIVIGLAVTFLSLLVVPVFYVVIQWLRERFNMAKEIKVAASDDAS